MNLKKLSDEDLEQELDRRRTISIKENADYNKAHEIERKAWQAWSASVYAVEAVTKEVERRNKRLRREMKPFHTFTRMATNEYYPLLVSVCSCDMGWRGEVQSSYIAGSRVEECRDILDEMEIDHLKLDINN